MVDISLEAVTGKLNRVGYDAFMQALRLAKEAEDRAAAAAAPPPVKAAPKRKVRAAATA